MSHITQILNQENTDPKAKINILAKVVDSLSGRLILKIYDKLNPSDRIEFEKLAESQDAIAIDSFLKTKIPGFSKLITEEFEKLDGEVQEKLT